MYVGNDLPLANGSVMPLLTISCELGCYYYMRLLVVARSCCLVLIKMTFALVGVTRMIYDHYVVSFGPIHEGEVKGKDLHCLALAPAWS